MKKILQTILRILAKRLLKKYKPEVIGITGSVGKTSTKEAIYAVLKNKFNVRRNIKNYNNEIGVPLTIIGRESGGRSLIKWLAIFLKALKLIIKCNKDYPDILILEMGADRPGDIKYLTSFIKCKIGILTAIGPAHIEFFRSQEHIFREKRNLITSLDKEGLAIINADDEYLKELIKQNKNQLLTFGFTAGADLQAIEINISIDESTAEIAKKIRGLSFKLKYQGSTTPVLLPGILGQQLIYAALAGAAVGISYSLTPVDISESLKNFQAPAGRMRLISGVKKTLIIDDTYNSSPPSVKAALDAVYNLNQVNKTIIVLADMLELGSLAEKAHQEVGRQVAELNPKLVITVGELGKGIVRSAVKKGLAKEKTASFDKAESAGRFLQEKMETGDIILIKGSQAMRLEKIVKEVMAEPQRAKELLVRQDESWQ